MGCLGRHLSIFTFSLFSSEEKKKDYCYTLTPMGSATPSLNKAL